MKIKQTELSELMPLIQEKLSEGGTVRFSPMGVSMLPMLRQGVDAVILSPLPEKLRLFDIPLYQRDDGKYILHRVIKTGEVYTCIGDNQYTYEHGVRRNQMIGVVSSFIRDEKEIAVTNPLYQTYCWIWFLFRPVRRWLLRMKIMFNRYRRMLARENTESIF